MALLLGGLMVAQLVTLLLTLILPPAPKAQYSLDDVAAALRGETPDRALQREIQNEAPQVSGPGWLGSEKSRGDLARLVGRDPADVLLAFYTPLPFAGTTVQRSYAMADDGFLRPASAMAAIQPTGLILAQYGPPPGGGGGFPGGGFPGGGPPSSVQSFPPYGSRPDAASPRGAPPGGPGRTFPQPGARPGASPVMRSPTPARPLQPEGAARDTPRGTPPQDAAQPRPGDGRPVYGPPRPTSLPRQGAPALPGVAITPPPATDTPVRSANIPTATPAPAPSPADLASQPVRTDAQPPAPSRTPAPIAEAPAQAPAAQPALPVAPQAPPATGRASTAPPVVVTVPQRRALFGLAPAPFVEGDFIAALRMADGRWAVVHPATEPFPNAWQRRVLLWFAIAILLVAPLGWLFARRLVKPLQRFAGAAEQLGRDPSAAIVPLEGPAEIGRAAHAFNLMQNRLRSFVDDRTAMVGAISHDLRTPLTRMRFRIEDVPDDVREGLLAEVDEMEAMIAQVIDFIRDASTPGARERLDLRALVDDVVEDARLVGADVTIERADPATVEVDVLGVRRLLDNLLENAVKYGRRASVRLTADSDNAVAEILDDGPGVHADEIERVFEPFYRSEGARASDKAGSGLGLAVCRSIARAHGGDVRLRRSDEGFIAEVRLPLAYGAELAA